VFNSGLQEGSSRRKLPLLQKEITVIAQCRHFTRIMPNNQNFGAMKSHNSACGQPQATTCGCVNTPTLLLQQQINKERKGRSAPRSLLSTKHPDVWGPSWHHTLGPPQQRSRCGGLQWTPEAVHVWHVLVAMQVAAALNGGARLAASVRGIRPTWLRHGQQNSSIALMGPVQCCVHALHASKHCLSYS
jgi:hypothetical protein